MRVRVRFNLILISNGGKTKMSIEGLIRTTITICRGRLKIGAIIVINNKSNGINLELISLNNRKIILNYIISVIRGKDILYYNISLTGNRFILFQEAINCFHKSCESSNADKYVDNEATYTDNEGIYVDYNYCKCVVLRGIHCGIIAEREVTTDESVNLQFFIKNMFLEDGNFICKMKNLFKLLHYKSHKFFSINMSDTEFERLRIFFNINLKEHK